MAYFTGQPTGQINTLPTYSSSPYTSGGYGQMAYLDPYVARQLAQQNYLETFKNTRQRQKPRTLPLAYLYGYN